MTVDIEPAKREDIPYLADMWVDLASQQRELGSHLDATENRSAIHDSLAQHLVVDGLHVARDEEPVGFVMYDLETGSYEQDARRGVVRNIYVVPSRRGEGIGSRLLARAETNLANAGADVVALETLAGNDDARRF